MGRTTSRVAFASVVASFVSGVGAALPASTAAPLAAASGCAGSDCASDTRAWGSCAQGDRVDADTWESGPVTGAPWLDLHGERTWVFDPTPWMGAREPVGFQAYLSLDPDPVADGGGSGFAQPAGNLAEITPVWTATGWQVKVLNDTCAQYYLRLVLTYGRSDAESAENPATCGP